MIKKKQKIKIRKKILKNKVGEILVKNAVEREKGYLYYVDGNGSICRAKMARGGKKKKPAKKKKK